MNPILPIWLLLLSMATSLHAAASGHSPQGHAAARSSNLDQLRKIYATHTADGVKRLTNTDVNLPEPGSGQTPLMAAVLSGATESVRVLLLELNADPTIPEKDGYTPPHGAGFQGRKCLYHISQNTTFVSYLVKAVLTCFFNYSLSIDIYCLFFFDRLSLSLLFSRAGAEVAKLLIERHLLHQDCPIDAQHKGDHLTPLWRTTWGNQPRHIKTAEVMIKGGANVNYRVEDKWPSEAAVSYDKKKDFFCFLIPH